eukprot:2483351-Rhodomonas_salina.2
MQSPVLTACMVIPGSSLRGRSTRVASLLSRWSFAMSGTDGEAAGTRRCSALTHLDLGQNEISRVGSERWSYAFVTRCLEC